MRCATPAMKPHLGVANIKTKFTNMTNIFLLLVYFANKFFGFNSRFKRPEMAG